MATVSGTFTGEGVSATLQVRAADTDIDISVTAPFHGTVQLERATLGGAAWERVTKAFINRLASVSQRLQVVGNAIYRLRLKDIGTLISNGTFATDTVWTKGAGWTIAGGVAVATGAISTAIYQVTPTTLVPGASYSVTFTTTRDAGSVAVSLGGGSAGTSRSTADTFTETIVAGSANSRITFTGTGFTGTIDTVTISPVVVYSVSDTDAVVEEKRDADGNVVSRLTQAGLQIPGTLTVGGVVQPVIAGGTYTAIAADDTANSKTIATGLTSVTFAIVQVLRAGNVVTSDADVTWSAGNLIVADGATYVLTTGDVINWIAVGS